MTHPSDAERANLRALMDDLVPGAGAAGGVDYVEQLLSAFDTDPPRIWAGGPTSGRHGGEATFEHWLELGAWERVAWRERIDEWAEQYRVALDALGEDYATRPAEERATRRARCDPEFLELVFTHACESLYGDPVYGGNRDGAAWVAIDFRGDSQPAGYTDDQVAAP